MSRRRPLIGITPGFAGPSPNREFARGSSVLYCDTCYIGAIENGGGMPLVLTHTEDAAVIQRQVDSLDGLLLTGGEDVNPLHYSAQAEFPEFPVAEERDRYEFALLKAIIPTKKPVLAICRGHQVVNVSLGGTLMQDVPSVIGSTHHFQSSSPPALAHDAIIDTDSRVFAALGAELVRVNSYHHQAIDRVAPELRAVARSEEGLIEAVEHRHHPFCVGVQWHPERLCTDGMVHARLFEIFVNAALVNENADRS